MTERLDDHNIAVATEVTDAPKERHWGRRIAAITTVAALGLGASACGGSHEGGEPTGNDQPTTGSTSPVSEQSPSGNTQTHERTEPAGTVVFDKKGYLKVWPEFGTMSGESYNKLFDNPFLTNGSSQAQPVDKLKAPHDFIYKLSQNSDVSDLFTQNPFRHFDNSSAEDNYDVQHGVLIADAQTIGNSLAAMTEFMTTPQKVSGDKAIEGLHEYLPPEAFDPKNYPTSDEIKQFIDNKDTLGLYKALTSYSFMQADGFPSLDQIYVDALIAKYEDGGQTGNNVLRVVESLNDFVLTPYEGGESNFKDSSEVYHNVTQKLQSINTSSPAGKRAALKYLKGQRSQLEAQRQQMQGQTYTVKAAELLQDQSSYFGDPSNHSGIEALTFDVQAEFFDPKAEEGHQYSLINSVERWLVVPYPSQSSENHVISLLGSTVSLNDGKYNVWNTSEQQVEAKLQSIQADIK